MKGYELNITLEDSFPEISRQIIIPEKTKLYQLEKIMLKAFSLSDDMFHRFKLGIIGNYDDILIDDFINQTIPFEYYVDYEYSYLTDGFMELRFLITLNGIVNYKKNYPTLISYSGDYNLIKNTNSIAFLNRINEEIVI